MKNSDRRSSRSRGTSRRNLLKGAAGAASVLAAPGLMSCGKTGNKSYTGGPPNIVLLLADDFGIDAVTCYGAEHTTTPRIDRMAKEGLRFGNCYATPLCSPSRVELLTGLYPFRTGWTRNILHRVDDPDRTDRPAFLDPSTHTFATELRAAGYKTCVAGKWQLCYFDEYPDHCKQLGFDEYCCWLWQVFDAEHNTWTHTSRYWLPAIYENGVRKRGIVGRYGPDVHCDYLIDFMRRNKEGPFLAYAPIVLPHEPYQDTPEQVDPATVTTEPQENDTTHYRNMVTYMDSIIGRILDALVELGIERNTLVLFTSDNGTPPDITVRFRGVTRQGAKGKLSEAGSRVPLIAWWPGVIEPGRGTTHLVDFTDFMPTFSHLATGKIGNPGGKKLDGHSFVPVLKGAKVGTREFAFSMLGDARFVRGPQYKLYDDGRMFDVLADPDEHTDLESDPKLTAQKSKLKDAFAKITS